MAIEEVPQTLLDAVRYFADPEICNDLLLTVAHQPDTISP